jgi:hypothetical protein
MAKPIKCNFNELNVVAVWDRQRVMQERQRDVGVLERLGENTRAHVDVYITRVCLAHCVYL